MYNNRKLYNRIQVFLEKNFLSLKEHIFKLLSLIVESDAVVVDMTVEFPSLHLSSLTTNLSQNLFIERVDEISSI